MCGEKKKKCKEEKNMLNETIKVQSAKPKMETLIKTNNYFFFPTKSARKKGNGSN